MKILLYFNYLSIITYLIIVITRTEKSQAIRALEINVLSSILEIYYLIKQEIKPPGKIAAHKT